MTDICGTWWLSVISNGDPYFNLAHYLKCDSFDVAKYEYIDWIYIGSINGYEFRKTFDESRFYVIPAQLRYNTKIMCCWLSTMSIFYNKEADYVKHRRMT